MTTPVTFEIAKLLYSKECEGLESKELLQLWEDQRVQTIYFN